MQFNRGGKQIGFSECLRNVSDYDASETSWDGPLIRQGYGERCMGLSFQFLLCFKGVPFVQQHELHQLLYRVF